MMPGEELEDEVLSEEEAEASSEEDLFQHEEEEGVRRESGGILSFIFKNFSSHPLLSYEEEKSLLSTYLLSRRSLEPLAKGLDLTPEEVQEAIRHQVMAVWGLREGKGLGETEVPKELRRDYALVYQGEEARMRLILSNTRLVVSVAKRYARKWPNVPMEDIIQEGFYGLFKAIDRFDYKLANRLSTYASWWIRDAVEKGIKKYLFAHKLDFGDGAVHVGVLSLDEPVGDDGEHRFVDQLVSPSPEETEGGGEGEGEALKEVERILSSLPPREAFVLASLYGLRGIRKLSYRELGGKLGITETRVRQIERRAIALATKMVQGLPLFAQGGLSNAEEGTEPAEDLQELEERGEEGE
jgi:RNA polymerase sigma factor (sigma-70 family)